jgi:hypothetical protein
MLLDVFGQPNILPQGKYAIRKIWELVYFLQPNMTGNELTRFCTPFGKFWYWVDSIARILALVQKPC